MTDNLVKLYNKIYIEDVNTYLSKDGSGNIVLTDSVSGAKTLSDLGGSSYTLPVASATLGGIVTGTDITIDGSGNVTVSNYTHTHSAYDYSTALTTADVFSNITVVDGIVTGISTRTITLANLGYTGATDANNYSHPSHPGDDLSVDTTALTGATVVSDIDINVTTDTLGHVTDANGVVSTRELAAADIGALASGANAVSATKLVTARTINGVSFDGTANIVVEPYISSDDTGDTNCPITFTANSTAGYKRLYEDSNLYFDNTNNRLYASWFYGALSGNATSATLASTVTITANNSNNETVYPVFVDGATGTQGLESDTGYYYNPSTGNLTAVDFVPTSDLRLKSEVNYDISNISIDNLKPISFKIRGEFQYGFGAQDLLQSHPELVVGTGKEKENGEIDYYSIKLNSIIALNTNEIQKIKTENISLKLKINKLEDKLNKLEELILNKT